MQICNDLVNKFISVTRFVFFNLIAGQKRDLFLWRSDNNDNSDTNDNNNDDDNNSNNNKI